MLIISERQLRNTIAKNSLLAGKRPPPFGRDVMNLDIHRSGGGHLVFAFLLAPAAIFSATLVQKTPPVRPADADSPC